MKKMWYMLKNIRYSHGQGGMDAVMGVIRAAVYLAKKEGIRGIFRRANNISTQIDVPAFYSFVCNETIIPLNKAERDRALTEGKMIVNWLIPEMSVGSGGHFTIFRFATMLENRGIHNRIYVTNPTYFKSDRKLREFLDAHYNLENEKTEVFCNTESIRFAHATVATGWQTCYFLRRFNNTISKFYFVQDFEPCFFPMGTEYLLAENTYHFGFRGITAGDWLKEKMINEYHMRAESFYFSYDKDIFKSREKRDNKKRVFLYARPVTPRRCFELALLALCKLVQKIPELEVALAGWDVSNYRIPFPHLNAGTVSREELSDLYAQCDICIVMSSTNLSLMPVEIMASNSVVACTRGENNAWMVNEGNAIMLPTDPIEMADVLYEAIHDKKRLQRLRKAGQEYAKSFTDWDKEGEKVYRYIKEGIQDDI